MKSERRKVTNRANVIVAASPRISFPHLRLNLLDAQQLFIPVLLAVNLIGVLSRQTQSSQGTAAYMIMLLLFVIGFFAGAWGTSRTSLRLLTTPEIFRSATIQRSRIAFFLCQLYFLYIAADVVSVYVASGGAAFSTMRFTIRDSINSYLYIPLQFVLLVSVCYEIAYRRQLRAALLRRPRRLANTSLAAPMVAIYILEVALIGSRSVLLVATVCFFMAWLRGSNRSIPAVWLVAAVSLGALFFGIVSYYRLYLDPETLAWWVSERILDEPAGSLLAFLSGGTALALYTISDIFDRAVSVVHAIDAGQLDHMLGAVSFFLIYSALPGYQEHPAVFLNYALFQTGTDNPIPAPLVSQLYLDFGWVGVLLGSWVIGFGVKAAVWAADRSRSVVWSTLHAFLVAQLLLSVYGEFNAGLSLFYAAIGGLLFVWLDGGRPHASHGGYIRALVRDRLTGMASSSDTPQTRGSQSQ